MRVTTKLLHRFWSRVNKSGGEDACWEWTGSDTGAPWRYGKFYVKMHDDQPGKSYLAHRISYALAHGNVLPPSGMDVCHRCDNPRCVNPAHLFLGTRKENMRDCWQKGRQFLPPPRKGEDSTSAKLTWEIVREIRAVPEGRRGPLKAIREKYGVSTATIRHIRSGRTWRE